MLAGGRKRGSLYACYECLDKFLGCCWFTPEDFRFFADHGADGVFLQGNRSGGGELAEVRSYLIARCLWDPYDDWRQHMKEFVEA